MPARAMASGMVSFGLVSIPVKVYATGESSSGISFNWLHKKCGSRLKQQYVCPQDNEAVGRDDMMKGYEFAKGQFVTFTEQEIKELQETPTQALEITEFVPAETVDAVFFDKAYYLGPDKGADRAYRLLVEALSVTGRVALAKYRARGHQYLVMLRPYGKKGLVLQQLHYHHEVRSFDEVPIGDAEVKEPELNLAKALIQQASTETFRPQAYQDEVHERALALIQQKVEGRDVSFAPPAEPQAQIIDLMEALKASLGRPAAPAAAPSPAPAAEATGTDDARPARRAVSPRPKGERKPAKG